MLSIRFVVSCRDCRSAASSALVVITPRLWRISRACPASPVGFYWSFSLRRFDCGSVVLSGRSGWSFSLFVQLAAGLTWVLLGIGAAVLPVFPLALDVALTVPAIPVLVIASSQRLVASNVESSR
jgi:hypothetical protein